MVGLLRYLPIAATPAILVGYVLVVAGDKARWRWRLRRLRRGESW